MDELYKARALKRSMGSKAQAPKSMGVEEPAAETIMNNPNLEASRQSKGMEDYNQNLADKG